LVIVARLVSLFCGNKPSGLENACISYVGAGFKPWSPYFLHLFLKNSLQQQTKGTTQKENCDSINAVNLLRLMEKEALA